MSLVAPITLPRADFAAARHAEALRARRHPFAQWYLCPAAFQLAQRLAPTAARPLHLTLAGMLAATLAALCIALAPAWHVLAAVLVLTHWFFDRADGQLARLQDSATPLGAWLDANLDELADLSMQAAVAYSLFQAHFSHWPITLLVLFLVGKYLFMVGLWLEATAAPAPSSEVGQARNHSSLLHSSYHFLANADVRVHLLALALFAGQLWIQLALVAVYYNVRWLARYLLVVQRLRRAAA